MYQEAINEAKARTRRNSRSWFEYENGKAILREAGLTWQEYERALAELAAWVGV